MDEICHNGFVSRINSNKIYVRIVSQSACSECHAKGACTVSDKADKEIEISDYKGKYHVGQQVTVTMRQSMGMKAILLGYILPFFVLFITLFITIQLTGDEIAGGLIALGMLVPYYAAIFIFRKAIQRSFRFELKET